MSDTTVINSAFPREKKNSKELQSKVKLTSILGSILEHQEMKYSLCENIQGRKKIIKSQLQFIKINLLPANSVLFYNMKPRLEGRIIDVPHLHFGNYLIRFTTFS